MTENAGRPCQPASHRGEQAGIIHLLPLLLVAALLVVGALLVLGIKVKIPTKDTASVELQAGYSNPFNKDSQYINPFSEYKNPFDSLR